ncbi:hypothetical protein AVDCRST_MAG94-5099 [uncultured Leptolyngbya sp.]|uniref:Uncharacterized protein n=1 Tax=uncultured Leptolyngbya sp. TaxID=332963 RepID=A0A6J4NG14_9CYAN|nr:hypothetical protein AVDCRST_MAG94-5099 [uncultured Leptolyngbya sp.]
MRPYVRNKAFDRVSPAWSGTPQHQPKVLVPGGGFLNATAFTLSSNAIVVTVGAAGAAANATSVPVAALTDNRTETTNTTVLIPAGTLLDFTGAGKYARLTAPAFKGATTLTVEALPQALVSGDTAGYSAGGNLYVRSGILIGRTYAERDAGVGYGPADVATPDDEIHLLFFDVYNATDDPECEMYMAKAGNVVYENFLPNWDSLPSAQKTWIRANYTCLKGVA